MLSPRQRFSNANVNCPLILDRFSTTRGDQSLGAKGPVSPTWSHHLFSRELERFLSWTFPVGSGFYVYQCSVPECGRVYSRLRGYYDFPKETDIHRLPCPHDAQALFRKEIESTGASIWECPRLDCGRQVRIRRKVEGRIRAEIRIPLPARRRTREQHQWGSDAPCDTERRSPQHPMTVFSRSESQ